MVLFLYVNHSARLLRVMFSVLYKFVLIYSYVPYEKGTLIPYLTDRETVA